MVQKKSGVTYIKDSEVGNLNMPISLCVFQNENKYFLVEVNTGYQKGSMKVISGHYHSVEELLRENKNTIKNSYPLLQNHIIYNDKIMSAL